MGNCLDLAYSIPLLKNVEICRWIFVTLSSTSTSLILLRSVFLPLGSPMSPVAPPTSPTTSFPLILKCNNTINGNKLPKCSDDAVGSAPQYNLNL